MDCGNFFPHYVMDYDHVRGEKKFNLSQASHNFVTDAMILEEISKCDLVCSNCHRIRSAKREPEKYAFSLKISEQPVAVVVNPQIEEVRV